MTVYFGGKLKALGCFGINATLFCGNLYRYEAKRTFLVVLATTRIDKNHGGRLELLTNIYDQKWRSTLETVGNLYYRGSKRSRKTYRLFSLHIVSIFVGAMQAPGFISEKSSRELYHTCTTRFSRDFYMNFNPFSAVPRDTRGQNF